MTATTVEVMQQRLTRGTPVIVADSFGKAKLRGAKQIVASKGTVDCNKGGRCAGDWCVGLAVFVTAPKNLKKDKEMGWRGGTTKICLTHLKNAKGELVLTPDVVNRLQVETAREKAIPALPTNGNGPGVVTWDDLARAHRAGDLDLLALLARKLKSDNDTMTRKVIATQEKLIESLSG